MELPVGDDGEETLAKRGTRQREVLSPTWQRRRRRRQEQKREQRPRQSQQHQRRQQHCSNNFSLSLFLSSITLLPLTTHLLRPPARSGSSTAQTGLRSVLLSRQSSTWSRPWTRNTRPWEDQYWHWTGTTTTIMKGGPFIGQKERAYCCVLRSLSFSTAVGRVRLLLFADVAAMSPFSHVVCVCWGCAPVLKMFCCTILCVYLGPPRKSFSDEERLGWEKLCARWFVNPREKLFPLRLATPSGLSVPTPHFPGEFFPRGFPFGMLYAIHNRGTKQRQPPTEGTSNSISRSSNTAHGGNASNITPATPFFGGKMGFCLASIFHRHNSLPPPSYY